LYLGERDFLELLFGFLLSFRLVLLNVSPSFVEAMVYQRPDKQHAARADEYTSCQANKDKHKDGALHGRSPLVAEGSTVCKNLSYAPLFAAPSCFFALIWPIAALNQGGMLMAAIAYTVVATFEDSKVAQEWLEWLHNGHVAQVLAAGATDAEIVELDGQPR